MQFRPLNAPPQVASDDVYDAPGEDWDGLPTTVEPGAGEIASGRVPAQPIDAEVENWYARDTARRLLALDLIEAQNWIESGSYTASGNAAGGICEAYLMREIYTVEGNDEDVAISQDGGSTWTVDHTVTGADMKSIAGGPNSVCAICDDGGSPTTVKKYGVTWTDADQGGTGANTLDCVAWDPFGETYLLGGFGGADGAYFATLAEDELADATDRSPPTGGDGLFVRFIAPGADRVLFANTENVYSWDRVSSTSSRTWIVQSTTGGTFVVKSLVYCGTYFYALVSDGTTSRVYESADGTTWTRKGAGSVLLGAFTDPITTLAVRGSALLFGGEIATQKRFIVSGDRGETWTPIHDPIAVRNAGGSAQVIGLVGNRYAAWAYKGAGERVHALALRMGPV